MESSPTAATVLRVLVADDIAESRRALCAMVREMGHEPIGADSGAAALELAAAQLPDVVLLDLLMPDLDGFEVTQRLRTLVTDRWLPVIVTSSLQGEEHFIHALQRGADDCLARPIHAALLDAKLRHYARVLGLQSRLAALAQRQRAIHDNILDAVVTLDHQGLVEEGNSAATAMFARGGGSLYGQHCDRVLGAPLAELLSQRELQLSRSDGTAFPAEVARSEWTQEGRLHHTLVIRDLTERRHIDRMKDEFLATVSHELRTPLTSVLGAVGLMASGAAGALPAAALPLAEVARRNGERLSRLIDDILDLTKLEGNRMVLHLRPVRLDVLLGEALAANQGYAQRTGVLLQSELAAGIPEVHVDAERFLQVMANLLSNAIKHSPPGAAVTVALAQSSTHARVLVRDQGPGVDPRFRARMFEKFSQADGSDRRAQGGTGLGLYISRLLVERMGGRVDVESRAGEGATFVVEFELQAGNIAPAGPLLLHVDRDIDARRRVADWLSSRCVVHSAADLGEATEALAGRSPAVIVADPQSQGSADAFCAALLQLAPDCPRVLYSDSVDQAFAQARGFTWLGKSRSVREQLVEAVMPARRPVKQGNA